MNKKKTAITSIIVASTLFIACTKKDRSVPSISPTALQITALDNAGSRVSGATVTIYTSQASFFQESGSVATQTTDANGQAMCANLLQQRYWFLIKKGCENNANSTTSTATSLSANTTSAISSTLFSTGTLRFVNNSSNPYRVFVNGVVYGDMNGSTSVNLSYEKTGSYTIRVLQLLGYAITPTDETYTGTLGCGGMLTTTFP